MKNLIYLTVTTLIIFISLQSFTSDNKDYKFPAHSNSELTSLWGSFLADAAGGLGGAAAVINLGGGACPYCVAGGAIIGAAAGSVGYEFSPSGGNGGTTLNNDDGNSEFTENEYDYIGREHNELIRSFYSQKISFSAPNYHSFIQKNSSIKSKYSESLDYMKLNYITTEINTVENLKDVGSILDLIKQRLPNLVNDKNKFINELSQALNSESHDEVLKNLKTFETSCFSKIKAKDSPEYIKLRAFFSILRYSSSLWNNDNTKR